jgi:hypothetical protein
LGKDRARRPAKPIGSADGAQARRDRRGEVPGCRTTIFFKIAAYKDFSRRFAQHLKKGLSKKFLKSGAV